MILTKSVVNFTCLNIMDRFVVRTPRPKPQEKKEKSPEKNLKQATIESLQVIGENNLHVHKCIHLVVVTNVIKTNCIHQYDPVYTCTCEVVYWGGVDRGCLPPSPFSSSTHPPLNPQLPSVPIPSTPNPNPLSSQPHP